jgi:hypothetical protein
VRCDDARWNGVLDEWLADVVGQRGSRRRLAAGIRAAFRAPAIC